jgi:hypothetical protein
METSSQETKSQSVEDRVLESVDREDGVGELAVEGGAPRTYEDNIVVWDDNDPENPYNWTAGKRWRVCHDRSKSIQSIWCFRVYSIGLLTMF